jgi:ADP-ribose pyrophosphatase YjhB (NUDIX family)
MQKADAAAGAGLSVNEEPVAAHGHGGASVIVLRRGAVLMVKRKRAPAAGLWSFPGGRALPGESAAATARRELCEETALEVGRLVFLGMFRPVPETSIAVFAARGGSGEPQAGDDAEQAVWVPLGSVLSRAITAGAVGWIARAIAVLAEAEGASQ